MNSRQAAQQTGERHEDAVSAIGAATSAKVFAYDDLKSNHSSFMKLPGATAHQNEPFSLEQPAAQTGQPPEQRPDFGDLSCAVNQ
jgi:hypothetical protein